MKTLTMIDPRTGLEWQRKISPRRMTWAQATAYAAHLELDGGSWRLPTVEELFMLADRARHKPAADPALIPHCPSSLFWTSTLWASGQDNAWVVDFLNGNSGYDDVTAPYRVRCVR